VALFDVRDQSRPLWLPSQELPGSRARCRIVGRHHRGKKAEVAACVPCSDADNREVQLAPDGLSDFPEWQALLADSMQSRTNRGGQPEQMRRIDTISLSSTIVFDTSKVYTERDTRTRRAFILGVRLLRSRDKGRRENDGP
jgi:hypothetical protein